MTTRSKVTIPPYAAEALQDDLDDAIKRRSIVEIRRFSEEAELSGMDQAAARGREIADVIEGKAGSRKHRDVLERSSALDELTKIKSVAGPRPQLNLDELLRRDAAEMMNRGRPFDRDTFEDIERRRVEEANRRLLEMNRQIQEQRARIPADKPERPWWR